MPGTSSIGPGAVDGAVTPAQPERSAPASILDGTYTWEGKYSIGTVVTIRAVISGDTIQLTIHNYSANEGSNVSVSLGGGKLAQNPATPNAVALTGSLLDGKASWNDGSAVLIGGYWWCQTRDGGKTVSLSWAPGNNGNFGGHDIFGPTGNEFQHGADTAWASIVRQAKSSARLESRAGSPPFRWQHRDRLDPKT